MPRPKTMTAKERKALEALKNQSLTTYRFIVGLAVEATRPLDKIIESTSTALAV